MRVKVKLPYGYGRAFFGKDKYGKPMFTVSRPRFQILSALKDDGSFLPDSVYIPKSIEMGPEMYQFLNYMPNVAARENEDLHYDAEVEPRPRKNVDDTYAYYGFGNNPDAIGNTENNGLGLIGYGKTQVPRGSLFDTFVYSKKLDTPSPNGENKKSAVLSNILNNSWDFNPLLGPLYEFTDTSYDPNNDPENKGPKPTDHWVPYIKDGKFVFRPDGTQVFRPVPLVQSLPIYNFKHPMYKEDADRAWQLVHDVPSALDWSSWGAAPSYADYNGLINTNKKGDPKVLDYLLANSKLAAKEGYFEDWPDIKKDAYQKVRDVKGLRSVEKLKAAREKDIDDLKKEQDKARIILHSKNHMTEDGAKMSREDMKEAYRRMFFLFAKNHPEVLVAHGVDPSEKNKVAKFVREQGFGKYNVLPSDDAKMLVILDDYKKHKDEEATQSNILDGVREPFNG